MLVLCYIMQLCMSIPILQLYYAQIVRRGLAKNSNMFTYRSAVQRALKVTGGALRVNIVLSGFMMKEN